MYVQSDTLLRTDVFENFRNKCIEIHELHPAHFSSASGLIWQACLNKTGIRLELLTDIDMLLIVEKGTTGAIGHATHRYAKANKNYMKNYGKNIDSSHLMYLDANNLYGWAMSQKLPVNGFEWIEQLAEFDARFIKNYDESNKKGYILEVDVEYPENLFNLHRDLPFIPKRKKIGKCNKLICDFHYKKRLCCSDESFKTSIKSWINTKKSTQSNSI